MILPLTRLLFVFLKSAQVTADHQIAKAVIIPKPIFGQKIHRHLDDTTATPYWKTELVKQNFDVVESSSQDLPKQIFSFRKSNTWQKKLSQRLFSTSSQKVRLQCKTENWAECKAYLAKVISETSSPVLFTLKVWKVSPPSWDKVNRDWIVNIKTFLNW